MYREKENRSIRIVDLFHRVQSVVFVSHANSDRMHRVNFIFYVRVFFFFIIWKCETVKHANTAILFLMHGFLFCDCVKHAHPNLRPAYTNKTTNKWSCGVIFRCIQKLLKFKFLFRIECFWVFNGKLCCTCCSQSPCDWEDKSIVYGLVFLGYNWFEMVVNNGQKPIYDCVTLLCKKLIFHLLVICSKWMEKMCARTACDLHCNRGDPISFCQDHLLHMYE